MSFLYDQETLQNLFSHLNLFVRFRRLNAHPGSTIELYGNYPVYRIASFSNLVGSINHFCVFHDVS